MIHTHTVDREDKQVGPITRVSVPNRFLIDRQCLLDFVAQKVPSRQTAASALGSSVCTTYTVV